jgi:hypothetical protein
MGILKRLAKLQTPVKGKPQVDEHRPRGGLSDEQQRNLSAINRGKKGKRK